MLWHILNEIFYQYYFFSIIAIHRRDDSNATNTNDAWWWHKLGNIGTIDSWCDWCSGSLSVSCAAQLIIGELKSNYFTIDIVVIQERDVLPRSSNSRKAMHQYQKSCRSKRRWKCLHSNRVKIHRKINWKSHVLNGTLMQSIKVEQFVTKK